MPILALNGAYRSLQKIQASIGWLIINLFCLIFPYKYADEWYFINQQKSMEKTLYIQYIDKEPFEIWIRWNESLCRRYLYFQKRYNGRMLTTDLVISPLFLVSSFSGLYIAGVLGFIMVGMTLQSYPCLFLHACYDQYFDQVVSTILKLEIIVEIPLFPFLIPIFLMVLPHLFQYFLAVLSIPIVPTNAA